jgi:hypothetical protein
LTKDEALKLALEALETCGDDEWHSEDDYGMMQVYNEQQVSAAITAIKEALAQPAPPPPECKTEAEQIAYAFGWWKALEYVRTEQAAQEPVAWMNNKDFEPIRVRIMQEAYELADRNDSESYNAIKVMCGDVQRMLPPKRPWVGLTDEEREEIENRPFSQNDWLWFYTRAIEAKLKELNT